MTAPPPACRNSRADALRGLLPFLDASDPETGQGRLARAVRLTVVPYIAGGVLYVAAGLLNPESPLLVLISAAAASFGGASALAWMAQLLRNRERYPPTGAPALGLASSWPWLVGGALTAAIFIGVLGPGVVLARCTLSRVNRGRRLDGPTWTFRANGASVRKWGTGTHLETGAQSHLLPVQSE